MAALLRTALVASIFSASFTGASFAVYYFCDSTTSTASPVSLSNLYSSSSSSTLFSSFYFFEFCCTKSTALSWWFLINSCVLITILNRSLSSLWMPFSFSEATNAYFITVAASTSTLFHSTVFGKSR